MSIETTAGRALPPGAAPQPAHLVRREIERELERMVGRLVLRCQGLDIALDGGGTSVMTRTGDTLKLMLTSPQAEARRVAAARIAAHLLDVGERDDPSWWACDLGRAIAREIGWPKPTAPTLAARRVLNVSRQAIDQMVRRNDLQPGSGCGSCVTRHSLQQAAARRWPFGSDI